MKLIKLTTLSANARETENVWINPDRIERILLTPNVNRSIPMDSRIFFSKENYLDVQEAPNDIVTILNIAQ